jgi:hypothetical protein
VQLDSQTANQNVLNLVVGKRLEQFNDFHGGPSIGNARKNRKKPGTTPGLLFAGASCQEKPRSIDASTYVKQLALFNSR